MALNLRAVLGLDASGYELGLDRANRKATTFANDVRNRIGQALTAGAIVAGANRLGAMFDTLADKAKGIRLGSQETGFDPNTFQMFANTLEATGVNANVGANSLEKLAAAMEEVKNKTERGGKLATDFAAFGVSLDDIARKDHKQVFFQIAAAMKEMEVTGSRLTPLGNVLGGKAGDLIPAMKLGFTSSAAGVGLLSEKELKEIDDLSKMGKEASQGWKNWGNEAASLFQKIRIGLLSAPGFFAGEFDTKPKNFTAEAREKINQQKLNSAAIQQAKEQNDARIKAELEEKRSKEASKVEEKSRKEREQTAERTSDLKAQVGAERFSLLTSEQKLTVLKAQAEVLNQIRRRLKEEKEATGDPSGRVGEMLAQNELDRVRNISAQRSLGRKDPTINANSLQQMGARIAFNPMQAELNRNTAATLRNTEALLAAARRRLASEFDTMGVNY
jgi:hypothetical protein